MTIRDENDVALYGALTHQWDAGDYLKDQRYGVEITYITGEMAITRANEALGIFGWSSEIVEKWIDQDADEAIVHVRITAYKRLELLRDSEQIMMPPPERNPDDDMDDGGEPTEPVPVPVLRNREVVHRITHDSFGSAKIKRARSSGKPINMGYVWKSAETDGTKRGLTRLGIALHLYDKEELAAIKEAQETGVDRAELEPTPINQGRSNGTARGTVRNSQNNQSGPFPLSSQGTGAFVTRCCALVEVQQGNKTVRQRCETVVEPSADLVAADGSQYKGQKLIERTKAATNGHVLCQHHAQIWRDHMTAKSA